MIYRESECAIIYRSRERFGELSNMAHGFPILYENKVYPSSEALYQLLRYPNKPKFQEEISNLTNGMLAKRKAYEFKNHTRNDWQSVKLQIMEDVLRLKADQHRVVKSVLETTANMDIVEKSMRDDFWGAIPKDGNLIGDNALGLLWMIIREEIIKGTFKCEVTLTL